MSYVVLARKWRPQSFEDLVGQEHVSTTIANAIERDRVAHAFLFTGVRGVGKTTSARILAKALNCVKGPTPKPCQVCPACMEITNGSDVDVQEIDGASYTGVDDVRKLQESLPYRPQRDRFKIIIVDEVHMLSVNAWNAFLKTLEEPPPHVKFIFATTEVHKVPVTILSRCQRYDFKLIGAQTIGARLKWVLEQEKIAAEDGAVATIAREAAGSMRDAMSLLDQVIAWVGTSGDKLTAEGVARVLGVADRQVLHRLSAALVDGDAAGCVRIVGELAQEGYDIPHVAKSILAQLRDLAVAKVCDEPEKLLDLAQEEIADVKALAARAEPDDLVRLHQGFSKGFDEIVRGGQPRASLEMALIRLARRPPLVPVDELLRRLGDLERRLGGAPPGGGGGGGAPGRGGPPSPGRGAPPARGGYDGPRAMEAQSNTPAAPATPAPPPAAPASAAAPPEPVQNTAANESNTIDAPRTAPASAPTVENSAESARASRSEVVDHLQSARVSRSDTAEYENSARASQTAAPDHLQTAHASRSAAPDHLQSARASRSGTPEQPPTAPSAPSWKPPAPSFTPPPRPNFDAPAGAAAARPTFEPPPAGVQPQRPAFDARPVSTPPPPGAPDGPPPSSPPSRGPAPNPLAVPAGRLEAAPPSRPASPEEVKTWRAILETVRKKRQALASVLAHAQIFDMSAERVTLAYEQTSFLYAQATEAGAKEMLTSIVRAHFKGQTEVTFEIALGKSGTTIADLDARDRKAKQEQAKRDVAQHPLVVAAIRHLGAELIDVRLVEAPEAAN